MCWEFIKFTTIFKLKWKKQVPDLHETDFSVPLPQKKDSPKPLAIFKLNWCTSARLLVRSKWIISTSEWHFGVKTIMAAILKCHYNSKLATSNWWTFQAPVFLCAGKFTVSHCVPLRRPHLGIGIRAEGWALKNGMQSSPLHANQYMAGISSMVGFCEGLHNLSRRWFIWRAWSKEPHFTSLV